MKKTLSLLLAVLLMLGCMTFTAAAGQTASEKDFETDVQELPNGDKQATITRYNGRSSDVVIPATIRGVPVTAIGNGGSMDLFSDPRSLTSVTIPDGVVSIGNCAFMNCGKLSNVTIPDTVTSIGDDAFNGCRSLSSVTIPETVTSIGDRAFLWCDGLTSMTVKWDNPNAVTFGADIFYKSKVTLHVPADTKSMYKEHDVWKQFNIEEPAPSVALTSNAPVVEGTAQINAGAQVTITVTAEGAQNCADITLTYEEDVFDYTAPTTTDSEIIAPAAPDGTLRILSYNTAETIKTLTFTAKDNLTEDKTAEFGFESAKFADTESAMTTDAVEAPTQTGTSVKVISNKHTVTFDVDGEKTTRDYVGAEQTILATHIPNTAKDGYTFAGWSDGTNTYTTAQLTGMDVTKDVTYTAVYTLNVTVTVQKDYVNGTAAEATSYTKIIVTGDLTGYTYSGNAMYKVADKTFAYIVLTTDELKADDAADYAKGLVAAADPAEKVISVTDKNDVNNTGKVDIADARAVYNCANKLADLGTYMAVYICADVTGNGTVDTDDVAAVIDAIKTAGTVDANA